LRLIVNRAVVEPASMPSAATRPGTVLAAAGDDLVVAAGAGALRLAELQPAGKRVLTAAEFLRGYPIQPGEVLGLD
jgi:methionyl-tRNA formyltransferase